MGFVTYTQELILNNMFFFFFPERTVLAANVHARPTMSVTKNGYQSDPVWDLRATSRMGLLVWILEKEASLGHLPDFHRIRSVFPLYFCKNEY